MSRKKIFHFIIIFYIVVLFFIIGLIINKFTARENQMVATAVSFDLNQEETITTEKMINHIYDWMEMDVERSRSIIAESIPTLEKGQGSDGLIGEITEPINWLKKIINWALDIDMKQPDTYLKSGIPHLERYNQAQTVMTQQMEEKHIEDSKTLRTTQVIKGEKGSIYLNVPREELLNYTRSEPPIEPHPEEPPQVFEQNDLLPKNGSQIEITKRKPRVLIYHTHTTETYIDDTLPQDNMYHTLYPHIGNIIDAGKALADKLREKGCEATHITTDFVGKVFGDCYSNSRTALVEIFKKQNFDLVIDIHRDGVNDSFGYTREDFSTTINGKNAATLLYLYTEGNLEYSDTKWDPNKEICEALAAVTQRMYPGLLRKTELRSGRRYNLDLHPHALLIEIGFQRNTTEDAVYTAELLANVIDQLLQEQPVFLLDKR